MSSLFAWVATYLVHSTILILGAWLLERCWHARPERMSAVWKTALLGGVATASLQMVLCISPVAGVWDLAPPVSAPTGPVLAAGAAYEAGPGAERTISISLHDGAVTIADGAPAGAPSSIATTPAAATVSELEVDHALAAAPPTMATPPGPGTGAWLSSLGPWIVGALALGGILGLFSVIVAFAGLRGQLRGRRPVREGSLPPLLERLQRRAGLVRPVALTVAPRVPMPIAVGVFRPEIVVPEQAMRGLNMEHQESLLAHELAHIVRRDPVWRLLSLVVERVLFFQPLNRLASGRISTVAEYLSDDWAARHTREPLALAGCLTEIASWVASPSPIAAPMVGSRSILGRRVHRLLAPSSRVSRPAWLPLVLAAPLLAIMFAAPSVTAGAAEREPVVLASEASPVVTLTAGKAIFHAQGAETDEPVSKVEARALGQEAARANRDGRKDGRRRQRKADKDLRTSRKRLRKAVRSTNDGGRGRPTRREAKAILRGKTTGRDHVQIHVVVSDGEVVVEAEILEVLKKLEKLHKLEGLEELEALDVELRPVFEILEAVERGNVEVIIESGSDPTVVRIETRGRGYSHPKHKRKRKHKHKHQRRVRG